MKFYCKSLSYNLSKLLWLATIFICCGCLSDTSNKLRVYIDGSYYSGKILGVPDHDDKENVHQITCPSDTEFKFKGVTDLTSLSIKINDEPIENPLFVDNIFNYTFDSDMLNIIKICQDKHCFTFFAKCSKQKGQPVAAAKKRTPIKEKNPVYTKVEPAIHKPVASQSSKLEKKEISNSKKVDVILKENSTDKEVDNIATDDKSLSYTKVESATKKASLDKVEIESESVVTNNETTEKTIKADDIKKDVLSAEEERKKAMEKKKAKIEVLSLINGDLNLFVSNVKDIRDHLNRIETIAKNASAAQNLNSSIGKYNLTYDQITTKKDGISGLIGYYWNEPLAKYFDDICNTSIEEIHQKEILGLNRTVFSELSKKSQGKRIKMKNLKSMASNSIRRINRKVNLLEPKLDQLINSLKK